MVHNSNVGFHPPLPQPLAGSLKPLAFLGETTDDRQRSTGAWRAGKNRTMEGKMLRLATAVAVLSLLGIGTATADMIAGRYFCTNNRSELVWQGSAPSGVLTQNSRCGSAGIFCNTARLNNFVALLNNKRCVSDDAGDGVAFVCTEKSGKLTRHIDDLCKQAITGDSN